MSKGIFIYVTDLICRLQLPVLVVSRANLGTINHTLLTLDALAQKNIPVEGVVLNGGTGKTDPEKTNPSAIYEHSGVRVVGHLKTNDRFAIDPTATAQELARFPLLAQRLKRLCGL